MSKEKSYISLLIRHYTRADVSKTNKQTKANK